MKTILIVEDYKGILEGLEMFFRMIGYQVITAMNGREGLEKYIAARKSGRPIHLVWTDNSMPIMSGLVMARAIKEENPSQLIVMYTADEMPDLGFPVIQKPSTFDEIRSLVKELLDALPE